MWCFPAAEPTIPCSPQPGSTLFFGTIDTLITEPLSHVTLVCRFFAAGFQGGEVAYPLFAQGVFYGSGPRLFEPTPREPDETVFDDRDGLHTIEFPRYNHHPRHDTAPGSVGPR